MKLSQIKVNPANPRVIRDDKFKKLVQSLKDFPKMMELRPIIVDNEGVILGGNMRFRALQEIGFKQVPDSWVKRADQLTDEEKKRFIISDNASFGEWDWDMLANQWDTEELAEWGVDLPKWADGLPENNMTDEDVDITEDFDPVGITKDCQRVVFIFKNATEAESYLKKNNIKFEKRNMAWQVDMNTLSI